MRLPGIRARVVALNLGLVVVTATTVAITAEILLAHLAEEQALGRVASSGASAREALARAGHEVAATARVLAEGAALHPSIESGDARMLANALDAFQKTERVAACAVLVDGKILARSSTDVPWTALSLGHISEGPALIRVSQDDLVLVGSASIPSRAGSSALVARPVDAELLADVSRQVGLPVVIVPSHRALAGYGDEHARLLSRAVTDGIGGALRFDGVAAFCDVEPLPLATGQIGAALETRLPTEMTDRSIARLRRNLVALTLVVALLATVTSLLLAQRLAGPVLSLTTAAEQLGRGDLFTPVRVGGVAELGTLSLAMEDMRERLLHLTATLSQREAERTAILQGISEGVLAVDLDRRVRYLNPQAAKMLGVSPDRAMGAHCGDLLHPKLPVDERPCEERCPIVHARSSGVAQGVEHLELPSGTRTAVVNSASPQGERQVVMLRDETEMEAGLRMRDAILASVSHELRTPLSAQLASVEMLRDQLASGDVERIEPLVQSLERGTLRLTRLIDNLLESVRIEAGHGTMRTQDVALDVVVEEAVQQTAPLIHQRGQELHIDLPFPLPSIQGDRPRLVQVLVNLLANANKYANEGSKIQVGGAVSAAEVDLWVEDQGPGLPEVGTDQLFEPFVRSRDSEPEQTGVGLGLWVVRSIVERHGGRVEAKNTGTGARFTVTLPRRVASPPEGASSAGNPLGMIAGS